MAEYHRVILSGGSYVSVKLCFIKMARAATFGLDWGRLLAISDMVFVYNFFILNEIAAGFVCNWSGNNINWFFLRAIL